MNSYKLNGTIAHLARQAVINYFKLESGSIYRAVRNIENNKIIMYNGKVYELTLKEIENGRF
jgi:predicted transcriptional regulator